jgi:hypothetical protein
MSMFGKVSVIVWELLFKLCGACGAIQFWWLNDESLFLFVSCSCFLFDHILHKDKRMMTALIWAGRGGHVEIVKLLLEHQAEVESRTIFGFTALMYAASNDAAEAVIILLKHGVWLLVTCICIYFKLFIDLYY